MSAAEIRTLNLYIRVNTKQDHGALAHPFQLLFFYVVIVLEKKGEGWKCEGPYVVLRS